MQSRENRQSGRPLTWAAAAGSFQTRAGWPSCGSLQQPRVPDSSTGVGCLGGASLPETAAKVDAVAGSATPAGPAEETAERGASMESAVAQHYSAGSMAAHTWLAKAMAAAAGTPAATASHFLRVAMRQSLGSRNRQACFMRTVTPFESTTQQKVDSSSLYYLRKTAA